MFSLHFLQTDHSLRAVARLRFGAIIVMEDEGFVAVGRGGRRRGYAQPSAGTPHVSRPLSKMRGDDAADPSFRYGEGHVSRKATGGMVGKDERLRQSSDDLERQKAAVEGLLQWCIESMDQVGSIVALGLGCPTTSRIALAQVALLLRIRDTLGVDRVRIYDPACDAIDEEFQRQIGLEVMDEAEAEASWQHCAVDSRKPSTLFYMPHCDRALYESVLLRSSARNGQQDPALLRDVIIFGNSFDSYRTRVGDAAVRTDSPFLLDLCLQGAVSERVVPTQFYLQDVFNDCAIMSWI